MKACALLLSYGYGKPSEHIEVSGPDGEPLQPRADRDFDMMTTGELRKYLAAKKAEIAEARLNDTASLNDEELAAFLAEVQVRRGLSKL